jgi:mono/diheme cytochrome c family protein
MTARTFGEKMKRTSRSFTTCCLGLAILFAAAEGLWAQVSPEAPQQTPVPFTAAFPIRPKADPATLARGKQDYNTNCAYCHGEDARGGDNGGVNLLRSEVVMKDQNGERLRTFLLNESGEEHAAAREGILKFNLTSAQANDLQAYLGDLAAFIHDFRLSSRDPGRMRPPTTLVGDATAGQKYFEQKCASCHSASGDLKGIASRITDPRSLQQTWLMPAVYGFRGFNPPPDVPTHVPPATVTVTTPDGRKMEGRLGRIDDFLVTLTTADGTSHTIRRDGEVPKVEVHDPMKPHKELLPFYTDTDIHNVTAYLATLK